MERKKITVAVTGLNNTDNPGPGVPVIRGIRESEIFDVRIVGLAYENLEPGIYMPGIADVTYQIPFPSGGAEALLKRLEYIHSIEKIDVLIPNFDAELFAFMKSETRLKDMGISTFLPTIQQYEERQKSNLPEYGEKYGIHVPHSKSLTSVYDIKKLNDEFDYPLLVKGKFYDAHIANKKETVEEYFYEISSKWGLPVIVQEFITGTEVNVVAVGDGLGNTIGAVPMRKQYITDKGKAWGGITLSDEKMMKITHDLIAATKWRGGMELEMIKTDEGKYYMIEINPRIPAWVYLAVGSGQNLPEALVKLALGMPVEPYKDYDVGKMFVRYSHDLICDISQFQIFSTQKVISI